MAGKGTKGGTRGGAGDGRKLSYSRLITFDDIMTEALVDKVYFWATIRKSQPVWTKNPLITTEEIVAILRNYVINHNETQYAEDKLLQLPGFAPFYGSLGIKKLKDYFRAHLLRYINIYRPDCPFEITTTNRFTIKNLEASVTARRNICSGTKIRYLQGTQVNLTPEEDEELKRTKRDFSVVISGRSKQPSIFLGPARFCNHDCEPNATLKPCDGDGMEVTAIKDIAVGEEITVNYADNYFDDDNSKCLCVTCEMKLDKGYTQYDDEGQRILPTPLEEVEELDENGNARRVLRERRMQRDYKERPPTPSPPRRRRRPRTPSLLEPVPGLSEEFVRDESVALSEAPLDKERTPTPPPPPKRRVPRKMLPKHPDPDCRGIWSIFSEVRKTWLCDPGSTDEEDGAEKAVEDEVQENESGADSEGARILDELRDKVLVPDSVRDHDEDLGDCLVVGFGIITIKQSTPATSVDAKDNMDTTPSSTPRPSRGLITRAQAYNPLRAGHALSGSPAPGNGTVLMATMRAPATSAKKRAKRTASQMSSVRRLAPISIEQSESEDDKPIPRAGATAWEPVEAISDSDDHPIPLLPLTTGSTTAPEGATDDEDEDVTPGLLGTIISVAGRGTSATITQQRAKKSQGRPFNKPRELPAPNFYGGSGAAGLIMPISATPENSPPKIQIPSALKRKLLPTPKKGDIRAIAAKTASGVSLKAVDEGDGADSETDGTTTETPSRKRQKCQHSRRTTITEADFKDEEPSKQEEDPTQRIPGDYLLTEHLLLSEGSAWMGCNLCEEFYVQEDAEHVNKAERYCPRCVRHAKLYGICWPETNPEVGHDRRADWLTILMEGKLKGLEDEGKRISRRRALVDRTLKKQQGKLDNQEEVDAQILKDENRTKTEDDSSKKKVAENAKEDKVLHKMGVAHPGDREIPNCQAESEDDEYLDLDVVRASHHARNLEQEATQEGAEEQRTEHDDDDTPDGRGRTIKCPKCGVQRKRKGNKKQRFGSAMRFICFVCVKKAESEIMAEGRAQSEHTGDHRSSVRLASSDPAPTPADEEPASPTGLPDRASPEPIIQSESDVEDDGIASPVLDDSDVESEAVDELLEENSDMDNAHEVPSLHWVPKQLSPVPREIRIKSCHWGTKTDWSCSCGLLQMVEKEGIDVRCNLTSLGMETLRELSHKLWARDKAVQLLDDVSANKSRELVFWIFEQEYDQEEVLLFYNQEEEEDEEAEERAQSAQPSQKSPQDYVWKIAGCSWENQFGCKCKLFNRIQEETTSERCFLTSFGIITLKKSLHNHEYRSAAAELLRTEELDETKRIFASVLRSTCKDKRMYARCFAGDHPAYTSPVEIANTPIDGDGDPSETPTQPDQRLRVGTTSPINNEAFSVDDDDASSTSSITFLGEKRIDGTSANSQSITSPVRPPRRLSYSSSAVGFNPANAPSKFGELSNRYRPGRRLTPMAVRIGTFTMEQYEEYMRSDLPCMPKTMGGSRDEAITLDDTPPASRNATPGPSMPIANMGEPASGASRTSLSRKSLGANNERPALLRPDGTPKSAREVLRPSSNKGKGKGKENQRQSAQRSPQRDEDSDEVLLDAGKTPAITPSALSTTPSPGTNTPSGTRRVRRHNRMGGRGMQYGV